MSINPGSANLPDPTLVLVDTSIWIRFFRDGSSAEAQALDILLAGGPVATCGPIRAEVISGAKTLAEFRRLEEVFDALVDLELPNNVWPRIAEHRFALARRGYQTSLIDLEIAMTAETHRVALWSLDEDFARIVAAIPFRPYRPIFEFRASP